MSEYKISDYSAINQRIFNILENNKNIHNDLLTAIKSLHNDLGDEIKIFIVGSTALYLLGIKEKIGKDIDLFVTFNNPGLNTDKKLGILPSKKGPLKAQTGLNIPMMIIICFCMGIRNIN